MGFFVFFLRSHREQDAANAGAQQVRLVVGGVFLVAHTYIAIGGGTGATTGPAAFATTATGPATGSTIGTAATCKRVGSSSVPTGVWASC